MPDLNVHAQEEKERQDLKAAHKQQPLHLDPGADIAAPSAVWCTVDTSRNELVLTFLNDGRLGFDLTLSGVSFIADDAPAAPRLQVGMALSAVQGRTVTGLSPEETRALWAATVDCRPLALAFAMDLPSSDAGANDTSPTTRDQKPEPDLEAADERNERRSHSRSDEGLRSPTVATQRMVEETVVSLVGLSKVLRTQQEQAQRPGQNNGRSADAQVRLDSSAIDTVNASAKALRAAADEIELLKTELRMFQQRDAD